MQQVCTPSLLTLTPSADLHEAAVALLESGLPSAPITDATGLLVGVLSEHDCLHGELECQYHRCPPPARSGAP